MARSVAIIGGGIAGAVTGLWLQHRGVGDVRILERRPAGGTTLCGEGLSDRTLHLLDPVFDGSPFVDRSFRGARWAFPGSTAVVHQTCHTMAREAWIPAMLDAFADRGGTVEFGRKVTAEDLAGAGAGARAAGDTGSGLGADHVIGADGPGSQVRKAMGATVDIRLGLQDRFETEQDTDWLEFVTDKRFTEEYAWWFPRAETHNVGILAEGDGRDRARLDAFIAHMGLEGRRRKQESYPIAFGGTRFVGAGGRMLLVGDAAGLTNPLTKGGMAAIMHAAPMLADAVARGRPQQYQRRLARHPLTHPSFQRALATLRRWRNDDLRRVLSRAPPVFHVHAAGKSQSLGVGARTVARRPWLLPTAWTFYQAGKHSRLYSW